MLKKNKIVRLLKRSDFFRNTSILISGTAIAQLIPILLQPVLRRLYSPETYGVYAVYTSLVGILYVLSSMRYEMAIIHPKKDKDAINLLALSQISNLGFNLLLFIVIHLFNERIARFLNIPAGYSTFLYLVPLGTFLYNFYQSHHYFLIRKKRFIAISINKFLRRGSEGTTQISLKYIFQQSGLFFGDIIGHFVNSISGIIQARKEGGYSWNKISYTKIRYVSKRYVEYPKFNMISSFFSVFSLLVPTLMINKFYSTEYAGFYDLSKLVLSIPLALIAGSIANVLLQRFSEKKQKSESIKNEFKTILLIVLVIAFMEIIVISFFGPQIFKVIFGTEWEISGKISIILVWSYSINFIVFSFSSVFISLERIKILSIWQTGHFLAVLSLFLFKTLIFNDFLKFFVFIEIVCL